MTYKVGDKVRVREDLVVDKRYGNYFFSGDMKPYVGKTMTISHVNKSAYYFIEDKDNWNWTDEMLEDAEGINILVKDNKVIAKKGDKVGTAKCSPEDEFDIFVGAKLALERLEEQCKPYAWLKKWMVYYIPDIGREGLFSRREYTEYDYDKRMMERGLVFKTEEEAVAVAQKMLDVLKED